MLRAMRYCNCVATTLVTPLNLIMLSVGATFAVELFLSSIVILVSIALVQTVGGWFIGWHLHLSSFVGMIRLFLVISPLDNSIVHLCVGLLKR